MNRVYFINQEHTDNFKIGFTNDDPLKRLAALQTGNPHSLRLCGYIEGDQKKETEIHKIFSKFRIAREWFKIEEKQVYDFIIENKGTCIRMHPLEEQNLALKKENARLESQIVELKEKIIFDSMNRSGLGDDTFVRVFQKLNRLYENVEVPYTKGILLKAVLACIVTYEKEDGASVKISYRKLARYTGVTVKTIGSTIKELEKLELIKRISPPGRETEVIVQF